MELRHIAIIMDGNGRWAGRRGLPRAEGHRAGSEAAKKITRACRRKGIPFLTLYALSTENLSRPKQELADLSRLLHHYLDQEVPTLVKHDIRLRVIGNRDLLSARLREKITRAEKITAGGKQMTLTLAVCYGGRDEILRAVKRLPRNRLNRLTEARFSRALDSASLPDPDLVIRTGGEFRLSNFLVWQSAYAELYFTRTLWPDFSGRHLAAALRAYGKRQRRFGRTGKEVPAAPPRPAAKKRKFR